MDSEIRRKFLIAIGIITVLYIYHAAEPFAILDNIKYLFCARPVSSEEAASAEHFVAPYPDAVGYQSGDSDVVTGEGPTSEDLNGNMSTADPIVRDTLAPQDLMPDDAANTFNQSVPSGQGQLSDQNYLTAGYHVGVNTVGQTLRNANRQIRSEPPNPQVKVSPWLQSTIETDTNRRPLEIGGCEA